MDAQTVGQVVLGVIGVGGGAWALYQLWNAFFGKFARKDAVAAVESNVQELKEGLHKLRGNVVTKEEARERRDEVNGLLEARRTGERDLHERLNEHIADDTRMHNAVLDKLGEIASSVARIEGRLEK